MNTQTRTLPKTRLAAWWIVIAIVAVAIGAFASPGGSAEAATATYNFNALSGSDVHPYTELEGQDGWLVTPFPIDFAVDMGVTATGGPDGTQAITFGWSGPAYGADASHLSGGSFPMPTFAGTETTAIIGGDMAIGTWGNHYGPGYDANSSGDIVRNQPGEVGPQVMTGTVCACIQIFDAAGVPTVANISEINGSGGDWIRVQLVMNFTANGGQGSGSLYYRNLTEGDAALQPVPSLQNVNLGLNQSATNATNPKLWNGIWAHHEGVGNGLDNLLVIASSDQAVGGAVALAVSDSGSRIPWTPLAAAIAGMMAVLAVAGWYGRKRWLH